MQDTNNKAPNNKKEIDPCDRGGVDYNKYAPDNGSDPDYLWPDLVEACKALDKGPDHRWNSLQFLRKLDAKYDTSFKSLGGYGIPKNSPDTKDLPVFKPFFDENEPAWLAEIGGYKRIGAYENVIFKGLRYKDYSSRISAFENFKGFAGLLGGRIAVSIYFMICPPVNKAIWILAFLYDASTAIAFIKGSCTVAYIKSEQKAICANYQEKTMEYIFREAYEKKYIHYEVKELEPARGV